MSIFPVSGKARKMEFNDPHAPLALEPGGIFQRMLRRIRPSLSHPARPHLPQIQSWPHFPSFFGRHLLGQIQFTFLFCGGDGDL